MLICKKYSRTNVFSQVIKYVITVTIRPFYLVRSRTKVSDIEHV